MKTRLTLRLMLMALFPLLPMLALAANAPAPKEGVDYEVIPDGKPFAPVKGKVEVAEVFSYACIHCAHFESSLQDWKRRQGPAVQLVQVPAALSGAWIPYARAYYAAELSGVLGKTHAAVFDALHKNGTLPLHNVSVDELVSFYAGYGVDRARFNTVLRGPEVDARLEKARAFAIASGVRGTPTLVVNGKYRVTGGESYDDVLRITDWLVARERGTRK